jgi:multicomponent Na+:H+ antiporter subunit E
VNRRTARVLAGVRVRLLPIAWLTLVWVLLWGTFSIANTLSGIALALVVTTVLPLPTVRLGGRLHLGAALAFALRFAVDLVRASWDVALLALRPGPAPASSIVAVRLRTGSELHLALTAQAVSLTPGSLVVELDPWRSIIYAHVLDAPDDAAVAAFRAHVHDLEAAIIRAVGSRHDLAQLQQPVTGGGEVR